MEATLAQPLKGGKLGVEIKILFKEGSLQLFLLDENKIRYMTLAQTLIPV